MARGLETVLKRQEKIFEEMPPVDGNELETGATEKQR